MLGSKLLERVRVNQAGIVWLLKVPALKCGQLDGTWWNFAELLYTLLIDNGRGLSDHFCISLVDL